MRTEHVDVAIIGAGTAGLAARREAVAAGARVVLINSGPWTTTCVRAGCMPGKLVLAAAHAARAAREADGFGIHADGIRVDGARVMRRVHDVRAEFLRGITEAVDAIPVAEKLSGHACFTGPTSLRVGDDCRVEAHAVVIATGSHPTVPDFLQPFGDRVLTTDTFFELDDLPRSLAVLGAGSLGIELGVAAARLGVATAVFDHNTKIGGLRDEVVARHAAAALGSEVRLHLGCDVKAEAADGHGVRVIWSGPEGEGSEVFEFVLAASGRPPQLGELDLPAAGLALDDRGTPEFDEATRRCGRSAVFIAGDAAAARPVLHEARGEGERAGRNAARLAAGEAMHPAAAPIPLSVVFTDPDMAFVGAPLESLGEDGVVGECDFDTGRARIENRTAGLLRLYARRGDRVLAGAEMVGPAVEHLAHLAASLVAQGCTVERALALPLYHPTYAENLGDALKDLATHLG